MSFHCAVQTALQEVHSISEKLDSGDYLTVSNNLKIIYDSVAKKPNGEHRVIPVEIIRKHNRAISEEDQLEKHTSFALTIAEQRLVMNSRFRRYYATEIEELNLNIANATEFLKNTQKEKKELYDVYKITREEDDKYAHKAACLSERQATYDLSELKAQLAQMKQEMSVNLRTP
jgi:hypothetical protein